jgi:hypothetical protein
MGVITAIERPYKVHSIPRLVNRAWWGYPFEDLSHALVELLHLPQVAHPHTLPVGRRGPQTTESGTESLVQSKHNPPALGERCRLQRTADQVINDTTVLVDLISYLLISLLEPSRVAGRRLGPLWAVSETSSHHAERSG